MKSALTSTSFVPNVIGAYRTAGNEEQMRHYLSLTDIARQLGITIGALASLKLPKPDAMIDRTRGWLPSTIDEWNAHRPSHGGREKER